MFGRSATVVLRADFSEIARLERFVDAFAAVSVEDRRRIKISATELFDNIIAHGRGVSPPLVLLRLSVGKEIGIALRYRAGNFKEFSDTLASRLKGVVGSHSAVRYDAASDRYRGLGLTMCRKLCKTVVARPGLIFNRISATFLVFR